MILGAGGATRGILQPILEAGPSTVVIANRTLSKAVELVDEFAADNANVELVACELHSVVDSADLVLNSTSLGLQGGVIELPPTVVKQAYCYDLTYGPGATFAAWAAAQATRGVSDGLGMLVEQAAESFRIWRGVRPPTSQVYAQLREQVGSGGR